MSTVHSSTLQTWDKMKRGQHKWFTIKSEVAGEEASPLIVENTGGPESTHAEFFASLPDDEPRVAVYDLKFSIKTSDGAITEKNKILVISWVPTGIKPGMRGVKLKMLATTSCMTIKNTLQIAHLVQSTTDDEITLEAIVDKASRFERDEIVANSWY